MRKLMLMLALPAWFSGCAVGPDFHRPAALPSSALPTMFGDATTTNAVDWKTANPSVRASGKPWWAVFHDSELDRLEGMAATNNQQIVLAVANFTQARAAVGVARADFLPQINASPSATRQRTSANTSPTSAAAGTSRTFDTFQVSADASWELDFWGRIRRQVEASRDRLIASADDLQSVGLSVQAEVAMDYFTLLALDAQSILLKKTADSYTRALELTQNRRKGGIATELDVAQAQTQLNAAQARIPAIDLQRAQTRHALAVLCGQSATKFAVNPVPTPTQPPAVPASIPSEWLESRPDVAAAERRMAAANAEVGVAKAAFYPRVLLNGMAGFESISATALFDWPSRLWAVGPTLQLPIFTGGRNRAQLAASKAAYEATVAIYRQTVLTAFQDVEDQLAAQTLLARQLEEEQSALDAAQRALTISDNRYKAGVEQYLDVIVAQTAVTTHEQNVAELTGQRLIACAALIKSLGAGWSANQPGDTASVHNP